MIRTKDEKITLKAYCQYPKKTITDFLELAISISEELAEIHAENIIHKDINPDNIVVDTDTKKALIKLAMNSMKVNSENIVQDKSARIEGSLQYIAPEQTGMVNLPLDLRSDLYSLGAVFYEMLTGKPPFDNGDQAELLHSIVAIKPVSPHAMNNNVEKQISAIVMKLLAKSPNERYQSVFGLIVDMNRCQKQLKKQGTIKTFSPGKNDISAVFKIPEKLYGRNDELALLKKLFSKVKNGDSQILMISGPPGIGKTFLVQEAKEQLVKEGGCFSSGKFDRYKRHIPCGGFIKIFRHLIRQLLGKSTKEIELFKAKYLNTKGINAQIIMDVIPELELIIGKQKQPWKLPANESKNHHHYVWQNFIKLFASSSYPLILFLDDLQWADTGSLELIDTVFSDKKLSSIMFVGVFRDIEAGENPSLMTSISNMQRNNQGYHTIKLKPVNQEYIGAILKDTLVNNSHYNIDLVQLILDKTCGNPLFIKEFLIDLYKNGFITFNNTSKIYHGSIKDFGWQVNLKKIVSAGLPSNVVDILTSRIKKLSHNTVEILKLASCIGLEFSLTGLSKIADKYENQLIAHLKQAIDEGLIIAKTDKFIFSHDKVQEVIYNLIDKTDKERNHYLVGKFLLNTASKERVSEEIYAILHQLNLGKRWLNHPEKNRLIELNLQAGIKAKLTTAYDEAVHFLKQGLTLLPDNLWVMDYQSSLAYYLELSEAEYHCRNFKKAQELFTIILDKARSLTDKLKVYELQLDCYTIQMRHPDVITTAKIILQELAFSLPNKIGKITILNERIKILRKLNKKDITAILNLPTATDPKITNLINIMVKIADAVFFSDPYLFAFLAIKGITLSLKQGHCQGTAYFYSSFAALCCQPGILNDLDRGYQLSKLALDLNNKFYSRSLHAKILFNSIFVTHWKEPLVNNLNYYQQVIDHCLNNADSQYCYFSSIYYSTSYLLMGKTFKETFDLFNKYTAHIKKFSALKLNSNFILAKQALKNDSIDVRDGLFLSSFYLGKIFNFYIYDDFKKGIDLCKKEHYFTNGLFLSPTVPIYYFFYALHLAANYANLKHTQTKILYYYKLFGISKKFKKWAQHNKSTYYLMYTLISAEIACIRNKFTKAEQLYREAIDLAKENGFIYCQAIALECIGKLYYANKMRPEAAHYINEAYNCYNAWGAAIKAQIMSEIYSDLIAVKKKPAKGIDASGKNICANSLPGSSSLAALDLQSINEALNLFAVDDEGNTILKKLLGILIKKAGAERVLLLSEKNDRLYLELECLAGAEEISAIASATLKKESYPESICRYVMRVRETVLLSDVSRENRFMNDAYFIGKKPKSILCMPVIWKTKLLAVIYMENNNSTNLFALNRHELFKNIVMQIAMFIDKTQQENRALTVHETATVSSALALTTILKKEYNLTNQEIKVALLFQEGFSREQICEQLNITSHTLRTYLKFIYTKTINMEDEELDKVGRVDKISRLILFLKKLE